MGKVSKKKRKDFENKETKQYTSEGNKALSSFFTRYGFLITFLLTTVSAFLIYSNTFSSPFHFDDTPNIVENYKLRDLSNFWPPSGTRYIGSLSFAINYHFGSLNVFGYHLVNIIIHIINSILVWWLVILTFRTPVMERINTNPQLRYFIAITASLLFVSHPIQTQAVTYIVQRFASLATLFYLLSLTLYIKAKLQTIQVEAKDENKFFSTSTLTFYLLSLISAILAMKTKEISFTLPFVVVLYEFMFFIPHPSLPRKGRGIAGGGIVSPSLSSLRGQSPKQSQYPILTKRLLYLSPFLLTLFIIPLSLIGTDKPVGDMIGELREAAQETEEIPRNIYLLTQFRVIVTYIRLLFLPINQNLDYDYPLSHSLFEPVTFLSFIFLSAIFVFAVYLFIRSRKMAKSSSPLAGEDRGLLSNVSIGGEGCYARLASFGLLWFFITLSVESSIVPIRDVIFEHRLYLPSIGAIIAFTSGVLYGVSYARERLNIKISLTLATCILLLATAFPLGIAAYKRNFVWKDEITLWEDVIRKSPNKARGHDNLGVAYEEYGRMLEAVNEYRKAIKLNLANAQVHYNLGNVLNKLGKTNEAINEYREAIRFNPAHVEAYYNLGNIYAKLGRTYEAINKYREAIRLNPVHAKAHNNLGSIYYIEGHIDEATEEYLIALKLKPDLPDAHYNLGIVYRDKGLKKEAIRKFKEALRISPDHKDARRSLETLAGQ